MEQSNYVKATIYFAKDGKVMAIGFTDKDGIRHFTGDISRLPDGGFMHLLYSAQTRTDGPVDMEDVARRGAEAKAIQRPIELSCRIVDSSFGDSVSSLTLAHDLFYTYEPMTEIIHQ